MKYLPILPIIGCFLITSGCRKELLTGSVRGVITAYDQYNYTSADHSGIQIELLGDSISAGMSVTDALGHFSIDDLPYGRYEVTYSREGFIRPYTIAALNHAGGGAPLYTSYSIYEVPYFSIHIDSVGTGRYDYQTNIYLKIDGDTILRSRYSAYFIVFASDSPDVSKDNYKARGKGYLTNRKGYPFKETIAVKGIVDFLEDIRTTFRLTDSIYIRAYPLADGQEYNFDQYLPGALGKPSNVIKCKWPG